MKTLTFELPDDLYEAFAEVAERRGLSVEEIAVEFLTTYGPKPPPQLTEEERRAAMERLLRHAGCVNSGDPKSADNERIDADLAREYDSTHEEEEP